MATVTKGRTFVSGETVTPAKLNELVDSATVTAIQTADISDAQITTVKIADANVTTAKIADANVTTAKIADANVTAAKLASNAVETAKINNAAVTAAKLDGAQTGSAPIYGCRAWVNFDGTRNATDTGASTNGANVLIRASGNVASVLKNATGDYTVTFTTAMPDANYAVCLGGGESNTSSSLPLRLTAKQSSYTTSAFVVRASSGNQDAANNTGSSSDTGICVSVFR